MGIRRVSLGLLTAPTQQRGGALPRHCPFPDTWSPSYRAVVFLFKNVKNINLKLKELSTVVKFESLGGGGESGENISKSHPGEFLVSLQERPLWKKSSWAQLSHKTHFPKDLHQVACDFRVTQPENSPVLTP